MVPWYPLKPLEPVPAETAGNSTHDGEEITVSTALIFGFTAFPLWVLAHYAFVDLLSHPDGQVCDEVFGL
ncbi:MAG TPA: hypothetical protein VGP93_19595 [Polyangiaceae bacterium]|nr:hypothetical protein [Polyangiaceae bacterium]